MSHLDSVWAACTSESGVCDRLGSLGVQMPRDWCVYNRVSQTGIRSASLELYANVYVVLGLYWDCDWRVFGPDLEWRFDK